MSHAGRGLIPLGAEGRDQSRNATFRDALAWFSVFM